MIHPNIGQVISWRKYFIASLLILSFFMSVSSVSADRADLTISAEVVAEVESELEASAEVAKELDLNLNEELELEASFDPVVPNNFFNSVRYGFKNFGRDIQELTVDIFASEKKYAQVVKKHSDEQFVEAIKLYSISPTDSKVASILNEYKNDLNRVEDSIEVIKGTDEKFARELSAKMAEDHLFVAPKFIGSLQDGLLKNNPKLSVEVARIKGEVFNITGRAILKTASNESELTETLKIIAERNYRTPFSGLGTADILAQARDHLDEDGEVLGQAFDQVITASLENAEGYFKAFNIPDELKAKSLSRYMEQLPGNSIARIEVMEQFRNQSDLSPAMLEKMTEVKAKIVENMTKQLEAVDDALLRQAMSQAMFEFKDPGIEELKLISEVRDLIPNEEIRKEMKQKHEQHVQKFLSKFADDSNAQKVTEEFRAISAKVESGEIVPDANFFRTIDALRERLSSEQQKFILETEQTGKDEIKRRMQTDENFAQRMGSFNPSDVAYFDDMKKEFDPSLAGKFIELEKTQTDNFRKLLQAQDDPKKVRELEERFRSETSEEVKKKFAIHKVDFEGEFRRHEERASEKERFFKQKREEMEREYREKFGEDSSSGPIQFNIGEANTNNSGFRPPRLIGPPVCREGTTETRFGCELPYEKKTFDPSSMCSSKGGTWEVNYCKMPGGEEVRRNEINRAGNQEDQKKREEYCSYCQPPGLQRPQDQGDLPDEAYKRRPGEEGDLPIPKREEFKPEQHCLQKGGTWTGNVCREFRQNETAPKITPERYISHPDEANFNTSPEGNFRLPQGQEPRPEVKGATTTRHSFFDDLMFLITLQPIK